MELTREQVASMLGLTKSRISTLVATGRLIPVNRPKEGSSRFVMRFDDGSVRSLKRELAHGNGNGQHSLLPPPPPPPTTPTTVLAFAQLDAERREVLMRLGQRYTAHELSMLLE